MNEREELEALPNSPFSRTGRKLLPDPGSKGGGKATAPLSPLVLAAPSGGRHETRARQQQSRVRMGGSYLEGRGPAFGRPGGKGLPSLCSWLSASISFCSALSVRRPRSR